MLVIKNGSKMIGETFINGRFVCNSFKTTAKEYKFFFSDYENRTMHGGIWITIKREGYQDDDRVLHDVIYPNGPGHSVTKDWFNFDNAKWTFEKALERY